MTVELNFIEKETSQIYVVFIVNMCACMRVHVCACVCTRVFAHASLRTCLCARVRELARVYGRTCVRARARVCVHVRAYVPLLIDCSSQVYTSNTFIVFRKNLLSFFIQQAMDAK